MPSFFNLDSSVCLGMPKTAAAPFEPATRPEASRRAFSIGNISWESSTSHRRLWTSSTQPARFDRERVAITEDYGTLNHILQFADVAWPRISSEELQRFLADTANLFSRLLGIALHEIFN